MPHLSPPNQGSLYFELKATNKNLSSDHHSHAVTYILTLGAVPTLVYYPSIPFLTSVALMAGTDKPPIAPKARKRTAGSFGRGRQQIENKNSFFIMLRCFSLYVNLQ